LPLSGRSLGRSSPLVGAAAFSESVLESTNDASFRSGPRGRQSGRIGEASRQPLRAREIGRQTANWRPADIASPGTAVTVKHMDISAFICHSASDKEFCRRLAKDLQSCGCKVWFDEWEIRVGDSIIEKIQNAIIENQYLVVVLSKTSVASEWVKVELHSGLFSQLSSRSIKVLPALLEECEIPVFLRHIRYSDFRKSYGTGFVEIRDALDLNGSFALTPKIAKCLMAAANDPRGCVISFWNTLPGEPRDREWDLWSSICQDGLLEAEHLGGTYVGDGLSQCSYRYKITAEGLRALEFRTHRLVEDK
jgi:TIR domain